MASRFWAVAAIAAALYSDPNPLGGFLALTDDASGSSADWLADLAETDAGNVTLSNVTLSNVTAPPVVQVVVTVPPVAPVIPAVPAPAVCADGTVAPCEESNWTRAGLPAGSVRAAISAGMGMPSVNTALLTEVIGTGTPPTYNPPPLPTHPPIAVSSEPFEDMQAQVRSLAGVNFSAGPAGAEYVWLPQMDTLKGPPLQGPAQYRISKMETPVPTPVYDAGDDHAISTLTREAIQETATAASERGNESAKGFMVVNATARFESSWQSVVHYVAELVFGLHAPEAGMHTSPANMTADAAMRSSENATYANATALAEETAREENATAFTSFFQSAPEPTLLLQVNADGTVVNLRQAKHGASPLKVPGNSDAMPLPGVYDPRPQIDMGIVGWASLPQVDHSFNLRTLGFTLFLLAMFYCIVGLGLLLTYKTAILHPEVKFFSGLKPQHDVCRAESTASILQAFNQKPKVRMQVKGKGLDFQLDLGSWLSEGAIASTAPIEEFVRAKCPFRNLIIVQQVSCPAARELEKRVRTKLEASGYPYPVQVHIPLQQEVKVFRNDQLANFLHNRTTRLLLAISGFGLAFWPVSWCKQKTHYVRAHWRLNIDVDRFWAHVGPRIYRGGFRA